MSPELMQFLLTEHSLLGNGALERIKEAILAACAEQERETRRAALTEAAEVIKHRLLRNDQRAMSWHECCDTMEAILVLRDKGQK